MMAKLSREHAERHADKLSSCLKMCEALSVSKCSLTRVLKAIEMSGSLTDVAGCRACTRFCYYIKVKGMITLLKTELTRFKCYQIIKFYTSYKV